MVLIASPEVRTCDHDISRNRAACCVAQEPREPGLNNGKRDPASQSYLAERNMTTA